MSPVGTVEWPYDQRYSWHGFNRPFGTYRVLALNPALKRRASVVLSLRDTGNRPKLESDRHFGQIQSRAKMGYRNIPDVHCGMRFCACAPLKDDGTYVD